MHTTNDTGNRGKKSLHHFVEQTPLTCMHLIRFLDYAHNFKTLLSIYYSLILISINQYITITIQSIVK